MGQDTVGCRSGHGHRTGQGHKLAGAFTLLGQVLVRARTEDGAIHKLAGAFTLLGQVSVRARTEDGARTQAGRSIHTVRSGLGQGTHREQDKDTYRQEHSHHWVRSRSRHRQKTGQGHKLAGAFTLLGQVSVRARTWPRRSTYRDVV
jgi:hypothetical protein